MFAGFTLAGWGLRLIPVALIAIVFYFGWTNVQSVVDRYTAMSGKIERLSHENALLTSRLSSYNLRIARRDDAIAASKCATDIKRWIAHPEDLPQKFDPFKQLGIMSQPQNGVR